MILFFTLAFSHLFHSFCSSSAPFLLLSLTYFPLDSAHLTSGDKKEMELTIPLFLTFWSPLLFLSCSFLFFFLFFSSLYRSFASSRPHATKINQFLAVILRPPRHRFTRLPSSSPPPLPPPPLFYSLSSSPFGLCFAQMDRFRPPSGIRTRTTPRPFRR